MYLEIYNNIINFRKINPLFKIDKNGSIHSHHIVPKYLGGLDNNDNLIMLTVREHRIVHFLLWKINKNIFDLAAYNRLGGSHKLPLEFRNYLSKINKEKWNNYSDIKKNEIINRLKPFISLPRSDKTKTLISKQKINSAFWSGDKNPFFNSNRTGHKNPMFGKKHNENSKSKMRIPHNFSEQGKNSLSNFAKSRIGAKNPNSKSIKIADKIFSSRAEAKEYFNVGISSINRWVKRFGSDINLKELIILLENTTPEFKSKVLNKI